MKKRAESEVEIGMERGKWRVQSDEGSGGGSGEVECGERERKAECGEYRMWREQRKVQWTLEFKGERRVDWKVENGLRRVERRVEIGEWMEWRVENGEQRVGSAERSVESGVWGMLVKWSAIVSCVTR